VATKAFFLLCSLFWQGFDVSMPAFSEMMVRGEHERLRRRFAGMVVVSETLSGVVAVIYAVCNSSFVFVWTHGRFPWSVWNDVLLGAWMIVSVFIHINGSFIILTKRLAGMRYVYPLEGLAFITVASLVARTGGFPAIIASSLFCSLCFSGVYGVWRINEYFQFHLGDLERLWLTALGRIFAFLVPTAVAMWWVTARLSSPSRLLLCATIVGGLGGFLFLRWGIPADLRAEILKRTPRPLGRLLEKIA
jgi:O-antigen/teichoic acid export membrane protein